MQPRSTLTRTTPLTIELTAVADGIYARAYRPGPIGIGIAVGDPDDPATARSAIADLRANLRAQRGAS